MTLTDYMNKAYAYMKGKLPDVPEYTIMEIAAHLANVAAVALNDEVNKVRKEFVDEIKKRLECLSSEAMFCSPEDPKCSYDCGDEQCIRNLMRDALVLIQQLEAERDAAVKDIEQIIKSPYIVAYCDFCKYGDNEEECAKRNCLRNRDDFEWRGVQKEDMNE